jgi:hypothetical protein
MGEKVQIAITKEDASSVVPITMSIQREIAQSKPAA